MTRTALWTLLLLGTVGCGASGHWVAQTGADPNADGKCAAQAYAGADTVQCKGAVCIAEAIRWNNIYNACLQGSGYAWQEDAAPSAPPAPALAELTPPGW